MATADTTCLCERCTALCCRYFALQIDTPEAPADFDDIRWYLAHENVHIFIEDGDWYLSVQTRCTFLRDDNKCGIYEDRPKICREFSTESCDFHTEAWGFEHYFTRPDQLEAYAHAKLGRRYERYVERQRLRNIGIDAKAERKARTGRGKAVALPSAKTIIAGRVRPHIKGHPSRGKHRRKHLPAAGNAKAPGKSLVSLSISAPNR